MAYTIKITNKNTDPNSRTADTIYFDSISPSLIIDPDTPYAEFINDMTFRDGSICIPLWERQQFVRIPPNSVLIINTDDSSEAIYYRQITVNDTVILVDPDPFQGSSGGGTLIEKTITENGTYLASQDDADGYSLVDVNVPNSYVAQDEGKVVSNGTLVSQLTHKPITTNGTGIDTTIYSSVDVDVPNTYTVEDNGKVVNNETLVSQTAYPTTITQNDTYDTTNYNSVTVNVSGGGSSSVVAVCTFSFSEYQFLFEDESGSIEDSAFYGCSELLSVTIKNNVTSIGENGFYQCQYLEPVTFEQNSSLETIGDSAFSGCEALTSITIPNSVTSIGENAFSGCSCLESVTFESNSSLGSIGNSAFSYCYALTSITIPNNVGSIGDGAFLDCDVLETVTFEPTTPPDLDGDLGIPTTCIIRVPLGSLDAYTSATNYPDPSEFTYEGY